MEELSRNTKLEIAVEILAAKIAMLSNQGHRTDSEEMQKLLKEREEMYKENDFIINKIINEYGPDIKNRYNKI